MSFFKNFSIKNFCFGSFRVPIPKNVLVKIFNLEKYIGSGDTTESFVAIKILTEKFEFYHNHRSAIMQIQQKK